MNRYPTSRPFSLGATALVFTLIALVSPPASAEPVTFTQDVAPIFYEHCVTCHRPGEVAPMSLMTYREARPWAKSILRQVSAGNMPPWSGESENHTWTNDISLSETENQIIVDWIQQGVREGDPADLPKAPTFPETWTLGEPDLVLTLDEVAVPASGDDLFPQQWIDLDVDEPKWIRAIEFLPGDRRVTHHFQSTYSSPKSDSGGQSSLSATVGILAIWTAGMPPYHFPEGMGRILNPGTRILVDSHYHPVGEATTDQTRIGLYFGEGDLKKEVSTLPVANTGLRIPPGAPNHPERAYYHFDKPMKLVAFSPHMHLRGKAMTYDLIYPDGRTETLLDVPKYDYNWQWLYYPEKPIDAPAGSVLQVTARWDNSPDNPANPDPNQEIIYRGDTFNEMFVGFVEAIPAEGVTHDPTPAKERIPKILSRHPAEDSYYAGGFLPFGLYVPDNGEEGWLYLVNGLNMFSISLDDFEWDGDTLSVRTQLPTPEASATTSTIEATRDDQGRLRGKLNYGLDSDQPLTVPFLGQPMASTKTGD